MAFNYKKKGSRALRLMDTPIEKKPTATGEWKLFEQIKQDRQINWFVTAKHRDFNGKECTKQIHVDNLTHWNFSHIKGKGMNKELRLDPENIEIVSVAYHFYEHNQQILKVHYKN